MHEPFLSLHQCRSLSGGISIGSSSLQGSPATRVTNTQADRLRHVLSSEIARIQLAMLAMRTKSDLNYNAHGDEGAVSRQVESECL